MVTTTLLNVSDVVALGQFEGSRQTCGGFRLIGALGELDPLTVRSKGGDGSVLRALACLIDFVMTAWAVVWFLTVVAVNVSRHLGSYTSTSVMKMDTERESRSHDDPTRCVCLQ